MSQMSYSWSGMSDGRITQGLVVQREGTGRRSWQERAPEPPQHSAPRLELLLQDEAGRGLRLSLRHSHLRRQRLRTNQLIEKHEERSKQSQTSDYHCAMGAPGWAGLKEFAEARYLLPVPCSQAVLQIWCAR